MCVSTIPKQWVNCYMYSFGDYFNIIVHACLVLLLIYYWIFPCVATVTVMRWCSNSFGTIYQLTYIHSTADITTIFIVHYMVIWLYTSPHEKAQCTLHVHIYIHYVNFGHFTLCVLYVYSWHSISFYILLQTCLYMYMYA